MKRSSTIAATLSALSALATLQRVHAQSISWKSPVSGLWNIAGNWDPTNVPDTATEFAAISTPGTYSIDLDISVSLGGISIDNPNATLNILSGAELLTAGTTAGTFVNNGLIVINPFASPAMGRLRFQGGTIFTGTGTVRLNAHPASIESASLNAPGIRNTTSHTISGNGQINAELENFGLVEANNPGLTLFAAPGTGWKNYATLRASNDGILRLTQTMTQGPDGSIIADGGTVEFGLAKVIGGTLATVNGGLLKATGAELWLNTVHTEGKLEVAPNSNVYLEGTSYLHNGEVRVNSSGQAPPSWFGGAGTGTVSLLGNLTITLNSPAGTTLNARLHDVIISPSVIVRGRGVLHSIDNRGIIEAAAPSDLINLSSFTPTNSGTIRATNGGTIIFTNLSSIRQPQGFILADGGNVVIQSTMNINGNINAVNNGKISIDPGFQVTFSGTKSGGLIELAQGASLTLNGSGVFHDGTVVINTTGTADGATLNIPESADVGRGQFVFNAPARDLGLASLSGLGSETIDHAVGRSLIGNGTVYGNHRFRGLVSPGNDVEPIGTLAGSGVNLLELAASSTVRIDIASRTSFDQFKRIKAFSMAGTLELNPLPSYTPALGDAVNFVNNTQPIGKFDRVVAPQLPNPAWRWRVRYGPESVTAVVTCAADFDADGQVTGDDFDQYVVAFSSGDIAADFNGDSFVTADDFDAYIASFEAGC